MLNNNSIPYPQKFVFTHIVCRGGFSEECVKPTDNSTVKTRPVPINMNQISLYRLFLYCYLWGGRVWFEGRRCVHN